MKLLCHFKTRFTALMSGVLILTLMGCGAYIRGKGTAPDDSSENTEDDRSADGTGPVVSSGVAGPTGPQGATGPQGSQGAQGVQGNTGEAGPMGGIVLYDANGDQIGAKFNEEANGVAHVVLFDHMQAKISRFTGALIPPSDNLNCLYLAPSCDGSCYVYDKRWLDFVVLGANDQYFAATRQTADSGALTMESYTDGDGVCHDATISTIESYKASAYQPEMSFPLSAPLYWDLAE